MNLACTMFRLTPEEALAGFTINGARALGMDADRGSLELGKLADLAVWDIADPADLSYLLAANRCIGLVKEGAVVREVAPTDPVRRPCSAGATVR